jgi:hypothetical protein
LTGATRCGAADITFWSAAASTFYLAATMDHGPGEASGAELANTMDVSFCVAA